MDNMPFESVDIYDDFGDAEIMVNTYCKLVTEDQYQEDTRSETDKALGELCLYLDQNPEVYSRVLRKRKQEEMESSGVISFVKSKVMSLLHGEQYPHCLVNASDCIQKTNALKSGMCKTFQMSQELKGNPTRHSSRLAAKRQTKTLKSDDNMQSLDLTEKKAQDNSITKSVSGEKDKSLNRPGVRTTDSRSKLNHSPNKVAVKSNNSKENLLQSSSIKVPVDGCKKNNDISKQNGRIGNSEIDKGSNNGVVNEVVQNQPALLEVSSRTTIPVPPPLPDYLVRSQLRMQSTNGVSKRREPHSLMQPLKQENRSSPRVCANKMSVGKVPSRSNSLHNLSILFHSDSSSLSSPFLTPELPSRYKTHKRSQSSSSTSSISSSGSFSSIHSEILASNQISRLKATPVVRSPGGTPARQKTDTLPTEPFHKALYTALKSKFRNVNTPSPRSGNTSTTASNNSLMNATFSP